MNTIRLNLLLISALAVVGFTGCKSEKIPEPAPAPVQKLKVDVLPVFGSEALLLDSVYTTAEGYDVKFTSIKFFVSGISTNNGATLDAALFDYANIGTKLLEMEGSPAGATSLSASLGVTATLNHSDPTAFAETSPLNILNSSDLHWGWNPGYIFVQIFAQVDTIQDGNALFDHFVTFHVGRDEYLQPLQFSGVNWMKVSETNHLFTLKLDMEQFLQNGSNAIDLKTEFITHTNPGQEAISLKVIQNLIDAISPY